MIEYHTRKKIYTGRSIEEVALEVLQDNKVLNKTLPHKPYPEDYNVIYNNIRIKLRAKETSDLHAKEAESRSEQRRNSGAPISFSDALRGAKAILNFSAGKVVESSEMSRRAHICSQCPMVAKNSDCATCKMGKTINNIVSGIRKMAGRGITYPSIGGRRAKDTYCGSCGCAMLMMLPAKISCFSEPDEKNQSRPEMCWARRDGFNFIPED